MNSVIRSLGAILAAGLPLLLSAPALATPKPPVSGNATVDGDAANATVSATNRQIDQAVVQTSRGWIKSFNTTWDAGVQFAAPTGKKAVKIGTIETVVSKKTSANSAHDLGEPGEQGEPTVTDLWLSAKHGKTSLVLKPKLGVTGLKASISGGPKPKLTVSGLPAGTFRVTFATAGRVGTRILTLKDGCGGQAKPMTATTSAVLADGKTRKFKTTDTSVICHGEAKPVG